jgi:hypothetical protein
MERSAQNYPVDTAEGVRLQRFVPRVCLWIGIEPDHTIGAWRASSAMRHFARFASSLAWGVELRFEAVPTLADVETAKTAVRDAPPLSICVPPSEYLGTLTRAFEHVRVTLSGKDFSLDDKSSALFAGCSEVDAVELRLAPSDLSRLPRLLHALYSAGPTWSTRILVDWDFEWPASACTGFAEQLSAAIASATSPLDFAHWALQSLLSGSRKFYLTGVACGQVFLAPAAAMLSSGQPWCVGTLWGGIPGRALQTWEDLLCSTSIPCERCVLRLKCAGADPDETFRVARNILQGHPIACMLAQSSIHTVLGMLNKELKRCGMIKSANPEQVVLAVGADGELYAIPEGLARGMRLRRTHGNAWPLAIEPMSSGRPDEGEVSGDQHGGEDNGS